jgi:hypothetical protein
VVNVSRGIELQLTDLIALCTNYFRTPPAARLAARTLLVVPLHEAVDKPEMSPVLATAAETLALSGKLWRWQCTDGNFKLTAWDNSYLFAGRWKTGPASLASIGR